MAPPARRERGIANARPDSTGVVVASMSLPCSGRPASSRSVSRAPRPASRIAGLASRRRTIALGLRQWQRDLEAVLAGVSGAGGEALGAEQAQCRGLHEAQRHRRRVERGEHSLGRRTLQRHQRGVDPLDAQLRAAFAQQREVGVAIAGVDHHAHLGVRAIDAVRQHQVVVDAAALVEQQRIALHAVGPALEVDRQRRLELRIQRRRPIVGGADAQLAHVRDVEQSGALARVQVLGLEPRRVLDRHLVAGETAELRAGFGVQRVQRNASQCGLLLPAHDALASAT